MSGTNGRSGADILRQVRWYLRGVTGADAYDRYLEHQARVHPGQPVMDKATFWRTKFDDQDANPTTRCC